jgi:hypothetical protein
MSTLIRLSQFSFLAINGKDAKTFMQGYTTCDIDNLSTSNNLGALCNLQGRMVSNFRIAETNDGLMLRMHKSRIADTLAFLSKYIVFSKAKLIDSSDLWHCYGVINDKPEGQICLRVSDNRHELWSDTELPAETDDLPWQQQDCLDGLAWIETTTAEQYLPQMFNLHNLEAIDFNKGCYLGQEIVARAQYLGDLKRSLHTTQSDKKLEVGEELQVSNRPIGKIVACVPHDGNYIALAVAANRGNNIITAQASSGSDIVLTPLSSDQKSSR